MASRHHSLEMTDVEDVAELLSNFEAHAGVSAAVALSVVRVGKVRTIQMTATAWEPLMDGAVPVLLASVSATCSVMRVKSLGGALTQLVYLLDGALACREMENALGNRA